MDVEHLLSLCVDTCPALGVPLIYEDRGLTCGVPDSPSVDRVVPALGYTKGNVRVVSTLANRMKAEGTVEQLERLLAYYKAMLSGPE